MRSPSALVDQLVARDAARAFEFRRHDGGEEVPAIAFDLEVLAGEPLRDKALDFGGCRVGHGAPILPASAHAGARPPAKGRRSVADLVADAQQVQRDRRRPAAKLAPTTARLIHGETSLTPKKPRRKPSIM